MWVKACANDLIRLIAGICAEQVLVRYAAKAVLEICVLPALKRPLNGSSLPAANARRLKSCHSGTLMQGPAARTVPRPALGLIARTYCNRYLRGHEVIEHNITHGAQQVKFCHERAKFRQTSKLSANAAHTINEMGLNPAAELEVMIMFIP